MALRFIDGCEDLTTFPNNAPVVQAGRYGNAWKVTTLDGWNWTSQGAWVNPTVTIGFALRNNGTAFGGANTTGFVLYDEGFLQPQLTFTISTDGTLNVKRAGPTGTLLGSSAAGLMVLNQWQYVEVQATINASTGTVLVRVNGTTVINLTAQNTKGSTVSTNVGCLVGSLMSSGTGAASLIDDLYVCSGVGDSFYGDCRVDTLYPNGNGSTNAWTGSDGDSTNNYLLVDEVGAPDTSDYVASSTSGQQDLYTLTDLAISTQAIFAVQPTVYAAKTDATARQIQLLTRRNATTAQAAQTLDNLTIISPLNVLTTDPETSAAWTPTNVNALQAGVQVV